MGDVAEEAAVEATEPSLDIVLASVSCPARGRANLVGRQSIRDAQLKAVFEVYKN